MLRNALIKLVIRWRRRKIDYNRPVAIRKGTEKLAARYVKTPRRCQVTPVDAGGVPAEWIRWRGADAGRVILYLHGGGYAICSPRTHRDLIWRLARACRARVLAPEYRMAPENPHPAAVEDAVASYRWLLKSGVKPGSIAVMGDSAGGGLTLVLLQRLRDMNIPLPACAVCLSPWTDLTASGKSMRKNKRRDPLLSPDAIEKFARHYVPRGDLAQPTASPLFGDFSKLPPLLIHAGTCEVLLDDARRAMEQAMAAGVETELKIWPGMIHVFQALAYFLEDARKAVREIGEFVERHVQTGIATPENPKPEK